MDEVDELSSFYAGKIREKNRKKAEHKKRLFEYVNFLKPANSGLMVPYNTVVNIVKEGKEDKVIHDMLRKSGYVAKNSEQKKEIKNRILYAKNWIKDALGEEKTEIKLTEKQKIALKSLEKALSEKDRKEKELVNIFFNIAKSSGLKPQEFFQAAYIAILGKERGPRLAPLILSLGKDNVVKKLKKIN
jgi:lysyl-tRNA synthetase class 1